RGEEINYRAGSETKKHNRIAILADRRQENGGDQGGDCLVEQQGNAHSIGANASGHQLRKREPYTYSGADGEECHKKAETDRNQPAVFRIGHRSDEGIINFERSLAGSIEIAEWIRKKCDHLIGGQTTVAADLDGFRGRIVGTHNLACSLEISAGIDDDQRGGLRGCGLRQESLGAVAFEEKRSGSAGVVEEAQLLMSVDPGLNFGLNIDAQFFIAAK